eukprot:gene24983-10646_t
MMDAYIYDNLSTMIFDGTDFESWEEHINDKLAMFTHDLSFLMTPDRG